MVSLATPLFSARSSWLITARRRRSRKCGRSMTSPPKTPQKTCQNTAIMLLFFEYSPTALMKEVSGDELESGAGGSVRGRAGAARGAGDGHLLAVVERQDHLPGDAGR